MVTKQSLTPNRVWPYVVGVEVVVVDVSLVHGGFVVVVVVSSVAGTVEGAVWVGTVVLGVVSTTAPTLFQEYSVERNDQSKR